MDIQWYPGHMTKARRAIQAQLKAVDIVVELVDARIPLASRNPDFDDLFEGKTRITLLNKADLADASLTRAWREALAAKGIYALDMIATQRQTRNAIIQFIDRSMKPELERLKAQKGIHKTVRALICGIPNVGKSALINSMSGGTSAKTGNKPGVTRGTQLIRVTPYLEMLDTPGILWPKLENPIFARHLAYVGSIRAEVMDTEELVCHFITEMVDKFPGCLLDRYKLTPSDLELPVYELLETIARARGLLRGGGVCDTERAAQMVLTEFRSGKLGRITLEAPEE